ncbi:MAG TPA: hypothetical protein VN538_01340 [Clostridia bacterium]|nr:hypothetical protein [Clostridia bacterium]
MTWLHGKKTYIAAALMFLLAAGGYWYGVVDEFSATVMLVLALGFIGVRDAIARQYAQTVLHAVEAAKTVRDKKPLSTEQKAELVQDVKAIVIEEVRKQAGPPVFPTPKDGQ